MSKLDCTSLPVSRGDQLCILNFSLSRDIAEREADLRRELNTIARFLATTFSRYRITYQLNCSFSLVHKATGDRRTFTGNFFPNSQQSTSLSGDVFRLFVFDRFVQDIFPFFDFGAAARLLLQVVNDETDWVFHDIVSFILSVQTILPDDHAFLRRHELTHPRAKKQRRHVTLYQF